MTRSIISFALKCLNLLKTELSVGLILLKFCTRLIWFFLHTTFLHTAHIEMFVPDELRHFSGKEVIFLVVEWNSWI